jgi:hypothetical protein
MFVGAVPQQHAEDLPEPLKPRDELRVHVLMLGR